MQGSCLFISSVRKHGRDGKKYPHRPYADGGVAVKEVLLSESAYSHHGLTNTSPMPQNIGASGSAITTKLWITSLISHSARFQLRTIYCFSFNASKNRRVPSQMGQTLTEDLISRLALDWGHLTLWNFAFLE